MAYCGVGVGRVGGEPTAFRGSSFAPIGHLSSGRVCGRARRCISSRRKRIQLRGHPGPPKPDEALSKTKKVFGVQVPVPFFSH